MRSARHASRSLSLQALYADEFRSRCGVEPFAESDSSWCIASNAAISAYALILYSGVKQSIDKIDALIARHSLTRDIPHMSICDLSALRIGAYSLLFDKGLDSKIAIDESVKLSLEFSSEMGFRFVNGVLDSIAKELATAQPQRREEGMSPQMGGERA